MKILHVYKHVEQRRCHILLVILHVGTTTRGNSPGLSTKSERVRTP